MAMIQTHTVFSVFSVIEKRKKGRKTLGKSSLFWTPVNWQFEVVYQLHLLYGGMFETQPQSVLQVGSMAWTLEWNGLLKEIYGNYIHARDYT